MPRSSFKLDDRLGDVDVIQAPNYCQFISMDPEFWLLAFKTAKNNQCRDDDDDSVKTQGYPILFRDLCWMAQRHRTRCGSGAMERSAVEGGRGDN